MREFTSECVPSCPFHALQFCTLRVPCTSELIERLDTDHYKVLAEEIEAYNEAVHTAMTSKGGGDQTNHDFNRVMEATHEYLTGEPSRINKEYLETTTRRVAFNLSIGVVEFREIYGLPPYHASQRFDEENLCWKLLSQES